jgi:hypothetical protein
MKAVTTLLAVAAVGSSSAFAPQPQAPKVNSALHAVSASDEAAVTSRRSALLSLAGAAAAAAVVVAPTAAVADESAEDMVARIAAKSAAANEAARQKAEKEAATKAQAKEGSSSLVLGAGAAGVALTLPFFLPNLLRLGSKLSSGGEDDGYGARK